MRTEDRLLKILDIASTPCMGGRFLTTELQKKLQVPNEEINLACGFLEKYGLIVVAEEVVQITLRGRQLLNLPDLPDDKLPSDQLEVLERHWGDEVDRALDQEAYMWGDNRKGI